MALQGHVAPVVETREIEKSGGEGVDDGAVIG